MDVRDHQQTNEDTLKTVVLCVVLILSVSVSASICISRYLKVDQKQNDGVEAFRFNLAPYYDAVWECAPEASSMGSLSSCVIALMRTRTRSFPFVRLFYVVGSLLFLVATLQLGLAEVSILVWGSILLCNLVLILAIEGAQ